MKSTTEYGKIEDNGAGGADEKAIAPVLERNIEALIARRRTEEAQKTLHDRVADVITRFTGSM